MLTILLKINIQVTETKHLTDTFHRESHAPSADIAQSSAGTFGNVQDMANAENSTAQDLTGEFSQESDTRKEKRNQEANAASIEFLRDSRRVADLLNGVIFHGKPVIMETDLQEKDPVIHKIINTGHKLTATENTLDLSVNVTVDSVKFLLMLQLQTHEHRAMPVRILNERGTDYYNQWKALKKKHGELKDLKSPEEFLSKMKREDIFYPVMHIIVYFGEKPWIAARNMEELLHIKRFPLIFKAAKKSGTLSARFVSHRGIPPGIRYPVTSLIMIARPVKPPVTMLTGSYTH